MKIGKYRDTEFQHLLIENMNDVELYSSVFQKVSAKENMGLLFGFKSQNFRRTITDYLDHEIDNASACQSAFAMALTLSKEEIPIIKVCQMSDDLIFGKIKQMIKFATNGLVSRVNLKGGFCSITTEEVENDYQDYVVIDDTNLKMLTNFILNKDLNGEDMAITKETIVIENARKIWKQYEEKLDKLGLTDRQVLANFKKHTILFSDDDFFMMLLKGIKNGLKNICISTTGQDLHQVNKFTPLFNKLLEVMPEVKLNMYLDTWNKEVIEIFSRLKNLNVITIK